MGEVDWGFFNLNILGFKEIIDFDFNLFDIDLLVLKFLVDEIKFDNDVFKV